MSLSPLCLYLSVSLYLCLSACLSPSLSLSLTGNHNNTVFILRLTAQSSDTTSQPLGLRTVHYRKKPPGQVFRDKRKAEERIAAMKHQPPQTSNSHNKDINRQVNFRKITLIFLSTADKDSQQSKTERVHNTRQQSKNTESSQHTSAKQEHREFTTHVSKTRTQRVHNTPCLKSDKHVQRVSAPVTVLT